MNSLLDWLHDDGSMIVLTVSPPSPTLTSQLTKYTFEGLLGGCWLSREQGGREGGREGKAHSECKLLVSGPGGSVLGQNYPFLFSLTSTRINADVGDQTEVS